MQLADIPAFFSLYSCRYIGIVLLTLTRDFEYHCCRHPMDYFLSQETKTLGVGDKSYITPPLNSKVIYQRYRKLRKIRTLSFYFAKKINRLDISVICIQNASSADYSQINIIG